MQYQSQPPRTNREKETITTSQPKPPPIYIEAPNINPLIEKLNEIVGPTEYTLQ